MSVEKEGRERATDRMSDRENKTRGERERDRWMNRGEESRRQTDKSNRHLQPHRQHKEMLHLELRDCVCACVS